MSCRPIGRRGRQGRQKERRSSGMQWRRGWTHSSHPILCHLYQFTPQQESMFAHRFLLLLFRCFSISSSYFCPAPRRLLYYLHLLHLRNISCGVNEITTKYIFEFANLRNDTEALLLTEVKVGGVIILFIASDNVMKSITDTQSITLIREWPQHYNC